MSALKEFFDRQRNLTEMKRQRQHDKAKKLLEMKNKQEQERQLKQIEFEKHVEMVKRTLNQPYLIEEEVVDYLWELDEDVYNKVVEQRNQYPPFVNEILDKYFIAPTLPRLSTQVVKDITDYDMFKKEQKQDEEYRTNLEKAWSEYKSNNDLARPKDCVVDIRLASLMSSLDINKSQYEEHKKSNVKRYIPPGARGSIKNNDNVSIKMENDIQKIENEINKNKQVIKLLDDEYEQEQKTKFTYKYMSTM